MKKITKVLMAAVAVSTLCFAGCKNANEVLGEGFVDYTTKSEVEGAEAVATIDYTNEDPNAIKRGLRFYSNKKKDIAVNVVMDNSNDDPGFMSVIFNKTENEDGTLNFIALGYNAKNSGGKAKIACSYYKNVSTADFEKENFGRTGDYAKDCIEILEGKGGLEIIDISPVSGKLTVGFVITANEGETPYEVRVYGNKTATELNAIADAIASKTTDDDGVIAGSVKEFSITNSDLGRTDTKKIDAGIGFYANVYAGKTLKGEWQVADISHNPDGIIWEDEIPNTLNIQLAE